jgi:hypothetical protein
MCICACVCFCVRVYVRVCRVCCTCRWRQWPVSPTNRKTYGFRCWTRSNGPTRIGERFASSFSFSFSSFLLSLFCLFSSLPAIRALSLSPAVLRLFSFFLLLSSFHFVLFLLRLLSMLSRSFLYAPLYHHIITIIIITFFFFSFSSFLLPLPPLLPPPPPLPVSPLFVFFSHLLAALSMHTAERYTWC